MLKSGFRALRANQAIQWQLPLSTMQSCFLLILNLKKLRNLRTFLEKVFVGRLMGRIFTLEVQKLLPELAAPQVYYDQTLFYLQTCFRLGITVLHFEPILSWKNKVHHRISPKEP